MTFWLRQSSLCLLRVFVASCEKDHAASVDAQARQSCTDGTKAPARPIPEKQRPVPSRPPASPGQERGTAAPVERRPGTGTRLRAAS